MGEFIGYKEIIRNFNKRAESNTLSHAHLIAGIDGIGKSYLARIFALKILGKDIDRDYVDIISYRPRKASFGVDEVREIIEEVNKKPFESDKKVIIIYEGNKLTMQAQNALLKTIEEPPVGVFIILLCESLELVLDTIKSRCQIYKLTPLSRDDIKKIIFNSKQDITGEELTAALAYSEGVPGRAERFLNDIDLRELRKLLLDLLNSVVKVDYEEVLIFEEKLIKYKNNKEELLNILASFIRDIMVFKESDNINIVINADKALELKELAKELSYRKLESILEKIKETRLDIASNSSFSISIRVMIIGFTEV